MNGWRFMDPNGEEVPVIQQAAYAARPCGDGFVQVADVQHLATSDGVLVDSSIGAVVTLTPEVIQVVVDLQDDEP